jgi:hypothetical protein
MPAVTRFLVADMHTLWYLSCEILCKPHIVRRTLKLFIATNGSCLAEKFSVSLSHHHRWLPTSKLLIFLSPTYIPSDDVDFRSTEAWRTQNVSSSAVSDYVVWFFSELKFDFYKKFFRSLLDYASYLTGPMFRLVSHSRRKTPIGFDVSDCQSVCLHVSAGHPMDGFSWNLIFVSFITNLSIN